jgi:opacity protein-like surface antigen
MHMRVRFSAVVFIVALSLAVPRLALAQGAVAHASVAAAFSDGEASPAFGGGVTWMFNRALGFGVELSHLPSLSSSLSRTYYCCGIFDDNDSSATVFTTNVRIEVPTTSRRIIPFVTAGGGVAGVTQSYSVIYALAAERLGSPVGLLSTIPILPSPEDVEYTNTNMALTLGGGASFLVTEHVGIDADLRVLHIMGNDSRNVGRFGVGVSYRF